MALKVGELYGELDLKTDKWDRGMGGIRSSVGKLAGWLAAAGIGAALAGGIYKAVDAASDLNESTSKVKVVFGDAAGEVLKFADNAAVAMGQSKQQALEAAGTFGNLFVSMGMADDQSAKMSTSLVQLAGDLASFNNIDPQEALDALRSGLVGETEPIRRLGVNMNDATLKAKALSMGLKWQGEVLPPLVKAQAAYALIMEQTKTAQGDYARTSGGFANQMRTLKAEITNLAASAGQCLLPVAIKVVGAIRGIVAVVGPAVGGLKGLFKGGMGGSGAGMFKPLVDGAKSLGPIFTGIKTDLAKLWTIVGPALQKIADYMGPVLAQAIAYVAPVLKEFGQTVAKQVHYVLLLAQFIRQHWSTIARFVGPIFTVVKTVIATTFKVIVDIVRAALALMRGDWQGAGNAVKRIVANLNKAVVTILKALGQLAVAILRAAWSGVVALTSAAWGKITGAVSAGAGRVVDFVRSIPGRILSALGNLGTLLYNAGSQLIGGLISGITNRLNELWSKVSSIAGKIKDLKGPLDYDRVLLTPAGNAIMDGLIAGIEAKGPSLERTLRGVTAAVTGTNPSAGLRGALAGAGAAGGPAAVVHEHYHIHLPGGSGIVGEADRVARVLAPYISRHQNKRDARSGRGR